MKDEERVTNQTAASVSGCSFVRWGRGGPYIYIYICVYIYIIYNYQLCQADSLIQNLGVVDGGWPRIGGEFWEQFPAPASQPLLLLDDLLLETSRLRPHPPPHCKTLTRDRTCLLIFVQRYRFSQVFVCVCGPQHARL
jgi:hypothetical protein